MQDECKREVKFTVQTIDAVRHTVEVPTDLSLDELRRFISTHCDLSFDIPANKMMMIHKGRRLQHKETLQDVCIDTNDLIVIMLSDKENEKTKSQLSHADMMHPSAMGYYNEGVRHYHGQGDTKQNYVEAFRLWTQSAKRGRCLYKCCIFARLICTDNLSYKIDKIDSHVDSHRLFVCFCIE